MKKLSARLALLLASGLAACGGDEKSTESKAPASGLADGTPQAATDRYSGEGDITEISRTEVTISHGPIERIGWPAMTMPFSVSSPELLRGLNVGDPVRFEFQQNGSNYVIDSINKA